MISTDNGTFCRFCLTSEDYTEDDEQGRFTLIVQSIWFVATHLIGAAIADSARKGDQLFVEGKIRRRHWTAKGSDDSTFVVTGFRFGARSGGPGLADATVSSKAPNSPVDSAEKKCPLVAMLGIYDAQGQALEQYEREPRREALGAISHYDPMSGYIAPAGECEGLRPPQAFERRVYGIKDLPAGIAAAIQRSRMGPAHDCLSSLLDDD